MNDTRDRHRGPGAALLRSVSALACASIVWSVALAAGCSSGPQAGTTSDGTTGTTGTGVAAGDAEPAADTAGLRSAAAELWTARRDEDWTTVFRYQDTETRESHTPDEYATWAGENEPFIVRDWTFGEVIAEGPMGWVEITSTTSLRRYPVVPPRETMRWEKWHREDGAWYPVPTKRTDSYPQSPSIRDRAEEDRLRARFGESWDARLVEDWSRLFEMSDPADMTNVAPEEFVNAHGKVLYLEHEIRWVEVVGTSGLVQVAYLFKLNDPNLSKLPPRAAVVNERWVKRDDTWYRDLIGGE